MRALSFVLAVGAVAGVLGCSPGGGMCRAAADCDKFDFNFQVLDNVGQDDDSEAVCEAFYQGEINSLRANDEAVCQREADDLEKLLACAADEYNKDPGRACDIVSISNVNPCQGELQNFVNAQQDAGNRCGEND